MANNFTNIQNGAYNLKESTPDVGGVLKSRRLKLADSKLGAIKDQQNNETPISRAENEDRNTSKT